MTEGTSRDQPPVDTLLVGYGTIGEATSRILRDRDFGVYDPGVPQFHGGDPPCAAGTVIVSTPCADGGLDCYDALDQVVFDVLLVRSTVTPEAMRATAARYPRSGVLHWPEFLSMATLDADVRDPHAVIVGIADKGLDAVDARRILEGLIGYDRAAVCLVTSSDASTLAKLATNSHYALQSWLYSMVYEHISGDHRTYSEILAIMGLDPDLHVSFHRPMMDGYAGYGGHCLPKDLKILASLIGGRDEEAIGMIDFANAERTLRTAR